MHAHGSVHRRQPPAHLHEHPEARRVDEPDAGQVDHDRAGRRGDDVVQPGLQRSAGGQIDLTDHRHVHVTPVDHHLTSEVDIPTRPP